MQARLINDSGMSFRLVKCAKAMFKKDEFVQSDNVYLDNNNTVHNLDHMEVYNYLGINEGNGIQRSRKRSGRNSVGELERSLNLN